MQGKTFHDFGLSEETLKALEKKGYEVPSAIQALVIPEFMQEQSNIIGQAQTGTGKTAAFSIPILEHLVPQQGVVKALILAPTRELAVQVSDEIYSITGDRKFKVLPVYGGQSIEQQIKNIKRGVDIVVGTPGRVIDLLKRKVLNLQNLEYFVLDEADEMLNMGFIDDIEEILAATNDTKKMLFFSATMPHAILNIAKKYMKKYKILQVAQDKSTVELTDQIYFEVSESDKLEVLCRVLDFELDFYGIIFAKTKNDVDHITEQLKSRGYLVDALHGNISQDMRNKTLNKFKSKKILVLVATDVAARGIDVNNLTHVINYSIPQEIESYVHRIGRTGRAGNKGIAITFVTKKESYQLTRIQRATKGNILKQSAPSINEIISSKQKFLHKCLDAIIKENDHSVYQDFAIKLLEDHDPKDLVAALLRHTYQDELLASAYAKITDNLNKYDKSSNKDLHEFSDQIKLFVAIGKRDGLTVRKLLELLHEKAKTPARKVRDIRILDNFSFITVPFDEAEIIMQTMNKEKNQRPIVTKAKK